MKRLQPSVIALTLIFSLVTDVQSGTLLMEDYLKFRKTEDFVLYLQGYLDGIASANVQLASDKQPRITCEPDMLALNVSNLKQLIDGHYEKNKSMYQKDWSKGLPFGVVALFALREAFPCK